MKYFEGLNVVTAWDLLTVAVQRWVVTLMGVVLTALAVFATTLVPPVYYAQAQVVLLPPAATQPNGLTETRASLVGLAGVLAERLRETDDATRPVSDSVTLLGEGRREGAAVRQQNVGGQWAYRFDRPVLEVQVVGETPIDVNARMRSTLLRIEAAVSEIQDGQGVEPTDRIRTVLNPTAPRVSEHSGSTVRAMGAAGAAGLLSTVMVLVFLGRRRGRSVVPSAGAIRQPTEGAETVLDSGRRDPSPEFAAASVSRSLESRRPD